MSLQEKIDAIPYWYHKITLPGGEVTPGWAPLKAERHCIPEDLTGMRVLDIGAWDGYWTWEAFKRGASEVVAIDDFSDTCGVTEAERSAKWATFDICREAFGFTQVGCPRIGWDCWMNSETQQVQRIELSVYDIAQLGQFDVVFFFGTLYHLKHPLRALEKISEVCTGSIYIETAALDDYSPYQGGIGHGFNKNERVMEFYPTKEYGDNESNWWVPTLQCLGAMLHAVGFKQINAWPLTEMPQALPACRGFASATKDPDKFPANRPDDIGNHQEAGPLKVAAVMSVPRLCFSDNMNCASMALFPLRIPLVNVQGVFWGQCLERGMMMAIDNGVDIVLTIDYDTMFSQQDVEKILQLMTDHPEAAAIVPMQIGRGQNQLLSSMRSRSGIAVGMVPPSQLIDEDLTKIATGHFGLTAFRTTDLLDLPHPWFIGKPNEDDQWGPGKIDDDIWFWKLLDKCKKTVLLANRLPVGHLELLCTVPDENLSPVHCLPGEYFDKKPENVWK